MFTIRPAQMERFEGDASTRYDQELVAHLEQFTPRLAAVLKRDGLQTLVALGREKSAAHGFSMRGNIRCFVELMVCLGSSFDNDHQLPWAAKVLGDTSIKCQMARAERLYDAALIYLDEVQGPDNEYSVGALRRLNDIFNGGEEGLRRLASLESVEALKTMYPEKVAYVGEAAVRESVRLGQSLAAEYGVQTDAGTALCTGLVFGFGSGIFADPAYPWIRGAITLPNLTTPGRRVERLLQRVRAYTNAMLTHLTDDEVNA